jgi:Tfp pilus tip-associated adhesin PilY1
MDKALLDSVFGGGNIEGNTIIAFDIWNVVENGINGNVHLIPPGGADAARMKVPFPSTPAMINLDPELGNRYDILFIPDAYGQLWTVDLRNPNPSSWEADCIFIPELPTSSDTSQYVNWHPAFYRPLVWKDPVYGDYWIAYGTGNRSDIFLRAEDRFYCLKYPANEIEDTAVAISVYTEGDLGTPGSPTDAGWMYQLEHSNEKVVTQAIYHLDSLMFMTFVPESDPTASPCDIGVCGNARSYSFDIRTGGIAVVGGTLEGGGLPQPPRYSYSLDGTGMRVKQISGKIEIEETKSYKSLKELIRWEEE